MLDLNHYDASDGELKGCPAGGNQGKQFIELLLDVEPGTFFGAHLER